MNNISEHMQNLVDTILETRYTDLDTDLRCCNELLEYSIRNDSAWGIAFAYTYLGDYYLAINDIVKSGEYLIMAREICHQNGFNDIYLNVCLFFGLYYSMFYDEQNALQCYLDGLILAKVFDDTRTECLILNNIAHEFHSRNSYENAKHYYLEARTKLSTAEGPQFVRLKILVLCNMTELFILLKDLPIAEKYLQECCSLLIETKDNRNSLKLLVYANQCCLAAANKNQQEADYYAKMLLDHIGTNADAHSVSKMLLTACKAMLELGAQEYSGKILDKLSTIHTSDDTFIIKQLVALKVQYHSIFSEEEEQRRAYRNYFDTLRRATVMEFNVRAEGMMAKINLREALSQHEYILQENQNLELAANIDGLTEIYNRRYINKLFSKMESNTDILKLGIVMIDVDYFKEYNDNYGHSKGDHVLISVAKVLSSFSNDNIIVGRYGGDEFICLLLDKEDEDIEEFLAHIYADIALLTMPHEKSRCCAVVTLSSGYSNCDVADDLCTEKLLEKADIALYDSKFRGRNQWSIQK